MTIDLSDFAQLPDRAELWVYGFARPLSPDEQQLVRERVESFLPSWVSHGAPVKASYQLVEDRFVLLAAVCSSGISGCSIDSSVGMFKQLQVEGLDALQRALVFYRDPDGKIQSLPYHDFQQRVDNGDLGPQTPVFDTTVRSLADLRRGAFELPFAQSWHARSFPLPATR